MKKKIAVLFLASVLALSAAACNGGSSTTESAAGSTSSVASVDEGTTESTAESTTESKDDTSTASESTGDVNVKDLLQNNYIDVVKDGKFYMKLTMDTASLTGGTETSGVPETITMVIAADTPNKQVYVDMGYSMMGFQKVIITEDKQWMLDDTNKIAYYMTTTSDVQSSLESMTSGVIGSTDNITYVSDSVETFNNKECYAVVYNVAAEVSLAEGVSLTSSSGLETEQTYYFDKSTNALAGIKVKSGSVESSMIVDELTAELPADIFTIPSDYTQTDMSSMMSSAE